MLRFIQFIQKRPQDKTIMIGKILFGLILAGVLTYNFFFQPSPNTIENTFFGMKIENNVKLYIQYAIIALWTFPLITGLANTCFLKKKYTQLLQIIYSILLFIAASLIQDVAHLDIDSLLFIFAFFPLFAGITGTCVLKKCLQFWEKITKIRV